MAPPGEDGDAEQDAVDGEGAEAAALDELHEGVDNEHGGDEGGHEADPEEDGLLRVQLVAMFDELEQARAEQGGYRQIERELGGDGGAEADDESAHDGGHGSGHSGDDAEALRDADEECLAKRYA